MAHGASDLGLPGGGASHGPGTQPGTDHLVDDHHDHPGESVYVRVAIILAMVTAIEVAVWYITPLHDYLVPILTILSLGKFVAVVGYFMHLKFDDRRFSFLFAAGLVVTLAVMVAVVVMFNYHGWDGAFRA